MELGFLRRLREDPRALDAKRALIDLGYEATDRAVRERSAG